MTQHLLLTRELVHKYLLTNLGLLILPKFVNLEEIPGTLTWSIASDPEIAFARTAKMDAWSPLQHVRFLSALGKTIKPVLSPEIFKLSGIDKLGREFLPLPELEERVKISNAKAKGIKRRQAMVDFWNEDTIKQIKRLKALGAGEIVRGRMQMEANKWNQETYGLGLLNDIPNNIPNELNSFGYYGPSNGEEDVRMSG